MAVNNRYARAVIWLVIILLVCSCASSRRSAGEKSNSSTEYITFVAVGDNLIHDTIIRDAKNKNYDFSGYYSEIADFVRKADLAFVNQETLIAGEKYGLSGYPKFNGPKQIGDALVKTGFDVVNHATNHTMDKGADAVLEVIDFWKKYPDITVLGIHESTAEREKPALVKIKGVTFGFLAYTYGLNGIKLPKDKPDLVSLIDKEKIIKEVDALRPLCDFLIVSMHWGVEYEYQPGKTQEELAALLAKHNVDLVVGHHPHVLQPVKIYEKGDAGNGELGNGNDKMYCYFSLGNFFSSQDKNERLLGAMLYMKIKVADDRNNAEAKTHSNKVPAKKILTIQESDLLPLVTHYTKGSKDYKVYFLEAYTDALALVHGLNNSRNKVSLSYWSTLLAQIFGGVLTLRE